MIRGLCSVLVVVVLTAPGAAQTRDADAWSGDGTFDDPWHHRDGDAGVSAALRACANPNQAARNRTGCEVRLPCGYVKITSTIDVGAGDRKYAVRLEGCGFGENWSRATERGRLAYAGTVLQWAGKPNGTVLKVQNVSYSRFAEFLIDGGARGDEDGVRAGYGIEVTADQGISHGNVFERISIEDVTGDPGVALWVGPHRNAKDVSWQVSHNEFDTIRIADVHFGVVQDGLQSATNHYSRLDMSRYRYGMDFRAGTIYVERGNFMSSRDGRTIADIRVHARVPGSQWLSHWASFRDNYHESLSGTPYLFPPTGAGARYFPTLLSGVRVRWAQSRGDIVHYTHAGPLTLVGCTFDLGRVKGKVDKPRGVVRVAPAGDFEVGFSESGNLFQKRSRKEQISVVVKR